MSISWLLDVEPAPAILVLPPAAASLDEADAAVELWEHYSRKHLDPTQRLAVQVMMAETAAGKWAASTTGREMPRQNGKGDEIEVVELWGLTQRAEAILHTVHDAVLLASQAQQRMLAVLDHPDLRRLVKKKWLGTGQQMIEMRNGGIIWYRTRTGGGGRGVDDVARLVVDEAQHANEEHLAALAPTLLANSNPQLNAMGTAGLAGRSDWWWSQRKRALLPEPGAFGYVGHTAETVRVNDAGRVVQDEVDVRARSLWVRANPALSSGRGQGVEFLEEQLLRLGDESFAREHLGVWDPPPGDGEAAIPSEAWEACECPDSVLEGRPQFGIAVADDRSWSAICAAGASSVRDGIHGEVVEYKRGSRWVAERAVELKAKWGGRFGIVKGSPAASLVNELVKAGLSGSDIVEVAADENARFCGQLYDSVVDSRFVHRGEGALSRSVVGAAQRPYGDAWVWSQRKSTVDVSPLVAVTTAVGLFGSGSVEKVLPDVILL